MDAVVSLVCVAGCALGMFLVATLLMPESRTQASLLLAALVGVACLGELFSAAEHLSQVTGRAAPRLDGFPGLLFAPLLFLYLRAQARGSRLRAADAWHGLGFAVLQSLALFESGSARLEPYLPPASLLVITAYALASLRLVYLEPRSRTGRVFHDGRLAMLALLAALASYLFDAAAGLLLSSWRFRGDLADVVLACSLAVLACSAIRRARGGEAQSAPQPVPEVATERQEPEKAKYGNNRLPDFARESIVVELQRHMQATQPWLKIDLTLGELAAGIRVSPHHLSQIINSEFGKSFAGYINEYRVGEACQLLAGDQDRSVLDVALDSGFSSKSAFNASFKKHTGMTPSEFRKSSQQKSCLVA